MTTLVFIFMVFILHFYDPITYFIVGCFYFNIIGMFSVKIFSSCGVTGQEIIQKALFTSLFSSSARNMASRKVWLTKSVKRLSLIEKHIPSRFTAPVISAVRSILIYLEGNLFICFELVYQ
ncbi:hypothetical protein PHYBLDRAFT_63468 [Phycomyces blakesleeanus NRRL 1555(-)]|uniref:Uncharacterized protein n=1 Tax=Phycomyces blakesleeanus (strain ATCC 8743b / DSM 1359 / FGSC 10004 / NBRC 33097 / NRRL 1555) TaxID=763407 RepID=A0A167KQ75_PHYB8|nr:hypothetical protein PHYBLDRAFT_63468 [Phycomyces blakesleeanus NRRL 1555(-)]OAD68626.1 hypothetical protein PHYBLDRAFT_63468 [Phycomyces blakesleeanus NRRL 1555(-)]|eukprot:XP_018286666.1 hypothetical protein PHYBLDRAFT_63468 [Phycomyces blakesleeanus NRRL 1555(-)]